MPKAASSLKVTLIPVNQNNAAGVLTFSGWQAVQAASQVGLRVRETAAWRKALIAAGVSEFLIVDLSAETKAAGIQKFQDWLLGLQDSGVRGEVLWLAESSHEFLASPRQLWDTLALEGFEQAGFERVGAEPASFELEVIAASPVKPGAEVIESVRLMEQLHSPRGDAWSWEQSHASLARYLLEETHEILEVLDQIDSVATLPKRKELADTLVSEFGDLLFQLVFHAQVSRRQSGAGWDLDQVALALNQKMYRRNPHVFGENADSDLSMAEIIAQYEAAKAEEKAAAGAKSSASKLAEGIPSSLPALQKAFKIAYRAKVAGCLDELAAKVELDAQSSNAQHQLAAAIMQLVLAAVEPDLDPESALRSRLSKWVR